nr:hypothetical protein [Tanacetum cinerariifolium]
DKVAGVVGGSDGGRVGCSRKWREMEKWEFWRLAEALCCAQCFKCRGDREATTTAGHQHNADCRHRKSFPANFSGEPQNYSPSPDLFNPPPPSPPTPNSCHPLHHTLAATTAAIAATITTLTLITAATSTMQRHQPPLPHTNLPPPPTPQQQRRLFQPLPPPWLAVGGGLATTAAVEPINLPISRLFFPCMVVTSTVLRNI